jgi:DNA-binding transcriptional LysR family regulator
MEDRLVWTAAKSFRSEPDQALPLVVLSAPCSIRDATLTALARHGVPWREAFVGTGVAAIQAAVVAGFGIACLEARNVPPDCVTQGQWLKRLPALPSTRVVIRARETTQADARIVQAIAAALKQGAPRRRRAR